MQTIIDACVEAEQHAFEKGWSYKDIIFWGIKIVNTGKQISQIITVCCFVFATEYSWL